MVFMSKMHERLSERMEEQGLNVKNLAEKINVNPSTIRDWKQNKYLIFLNHLVKLADCLNCSIDYLVGRSDIELDFIPQICPLFYERLREIMEKQGKSRYQMVKEKLFSDKAFTLWKQGAEPHLLTLERLATYLGVSIDSLIGRDR